MDTEGDLALSAHILQSQSFVFHELGWEEKSEHKGANSLYCKVTLFKTTTTKKNKPKKPKKLTLKSDIIS